MRETRCADALGGHPPLGHARTLHLASRIAFLLVPLLLAGCKSTPPPKPLDQLTVDEARGHQLFTSRCASCHYDRQTGDLHGPSLLGLYKKPYLPSGAPANDDRVGAVIQNGRNMMPPTGDFERGSQDFTALIAYLHTL